MLRASAAIGPSAGDLHNEISAKFQTAFHTPLWTTFQNRRPRAICRQIREFFAKPPGV
jgi:hypothetical protein